MANCPPGMCRSSRTTTAAPASVAAIPADRPATPPNQDVAVSFLGEGRRVGRQFGGEAAGHRHTFRRLRQARPLADPAVHGDDAIETGAHAAEQAARRAGWRVAERGDAGGR